MSDLDRLTSLLGDLRAEMATAPDDLIERLSDSVSELAEEAFDAADAFPLDPDTVARQMRSQARLKKGASRIRGRQVRASPVASGGRAFAGGVRRYSLRVALTARFKDRSETAVRDAFAESGFARLVFGTGGAVDFSAFHVYGTRHMPARLAKLDPERSEAEYRERASDVVAGWLGERLEQAGAPVEWIQQATGGRW